MKRAIRPHRRRPCSPRRSCRLRSVLTGDWRLHPRDWRCWWCWRWWGTVVVPPAEKPLNRDKGIAVAAVTRVEGPAVVGSRQLA